MTAPPTSPRFLGLHWTPRIQRATGLTTSALLLSLLSACASPGPDHAPLPLTAPTALGLNDASSTAIAAAWWTSLGDEHLNQLVEQALRDQPSLAVARTRVERAQTLAELSRAANGPQATLSADATEQRYSRKGLIPAPIAGSTDSSGTVQAALSWSPDWWGQQAAQLAAAIGQARAAQADAAAARTALATQVSRSYIALARVLSQQRGAQLALVQRQAILDLTRQRLSAGLDTDGDVAQAQVVLDDIRAQAEGLEEQIALARQQLAVLTGQSPHALDSLSPNLAQLQVPALPAAAGADLLGRRPDVVAARWRVEASAQNVTVARTQFYPNISLNAFAGLNALGVDQLFNLESRQLGFGPALRLPLFDGGVLRAQHQSRQIELDEAIAQYNSTLLNAVKEASNALSSNQSLERQVQLQNTARASANKVHQLTRDRRKAGLVNELAVLNTVTQTLNERHLAVDLRARQLDARVLLLTALGGGWQDDTAAALPPNLKDTRHE